MIYMLKVLLITIKYKVHIFFLKYINFGIWKCQIIIKIYHLLVWLVRKYIIVRNRVKYLYHKLTTYNTNKIWATCDQKCDCWPGSYDYYDGKCGRCDMWNKLSPKIKMQLEKECADYVRHCITGE
jgi:hypothetical protein